MIYAALFFKKARGWLFVALVFSTILGDLANINFLSMETYRGPDRGFEVNLSDLIALSLVIFLILRFPGKLNWLPFNSFWMFLFLMLAIVSTLAAPIKILAAFTLFKLIKVYLIFWCIVNTLRTSVNLKYIRYAMVCIGVLITIIALKQKYVDGLYRIYGPFDHSNTIPLYLNLIMPVLLAWGLADKHLKKWQAVLSIGSALGMVFTVVATSSRAGQALAAGGLLGTLVMANFRAKSVRVAAISVILLLAIAAGGIKAADTIIYRMKHAPKSSEEARDEFNIAARKMARDNPFGVGLNNFSHVLTVTPAYNEHIQVMKNEEQAGVAHHIYLLTAAEMGYPGLAVFVIIITRFALLALRGFWRSRSLEGLLLFGFFLGFCALHVSGFFEWALRITPVTYNFAIVSGISVALFETAQKKKALKLVY